MHQSNLPGDEPVSGCGASLHVVLCSKSTYCCAFSWHVSLRRFGGKCDASRQHAITSICSYADDCTQWAQILSLPDPKSRCMQAARADWLLRPELLAALF